jgi:predicted ester cyclase
MSARGREGLKRQIAQLRTAFPDLDIAIEDSVAQEEKVVVRWCLQGTHKGPLPMFGIREPTSEEVTMTGISIFRFENGKIVEIWQEGDYLGLRHQL